MEAHLPVKTIGISVPRDILELWNSLPYGKRSAIFCEAIRLGYSGIDPQQMLLDYVAEVNGRLDLLEQRIESISKK